MRDYFSTSLYYTLDIQNEFTTGLFFFLLLLLLFVLSPPFVFYGERKQLRSKHCKQRRGEQTHQGRRLCQEIISFFLFFSFLFFCWTMSEAARRFLIAWIGYVESYVYHTPRVYNT